ncbi:MAG: ORF6N domain-containing protein [Bacteroidales bacterium]|nr:ORF6N domain-containing protein [Bacteroidales bacterium]
MDVAQQDDVENRSLRQAVRRNLDSFPDDFMFRLSQNEANNLIARGVSQSVIPPGYNTGGAEMYAFTEQGVAMLATVLRSPKARAVSIDIMRAFHASFLRRIPEIIWNSHKKQFTLRLKSYQLLRGH